MKGLAAVAWLDACLDWIAGIHPMCPALEDWECVPVAVAAGNIRLGREKVLPLEAAFRGNPLFSVRRISEVEIRSLLHEALEGLARDEAREVLLKVLEGRIQVVGD